VQRIYRYVTSLLDPKFFRRSERGHELKASVSTVPSDFRVEAHCY
jgi:hypothetical protein